MLWCCCLKPDISNYKEVHELKIDEPVFQKLNASEYFIHLVDSSVTDYDKCCFRDQYRDRIQSPNEHVITYYYSKLTLFLRAFPARERSLERFKLDVLDGVYNTELRLNCQIKLCSNIKHEDEIKATLEDLLFVFKRHNQDPRNPNPNMARLNRSKYGAQDLPMARKKTTAKKNDVGAKLKQTVICFNCNKNGHISRDCWRKKGHRKVLISERSESVNKCKYVTSQK